MTGICAENESLVADCNARSRRRSSKLAFRLDMLLLAKTSCSTCGSSTAGRVTIRVVSESRSDITLGPPGELTGPWHHSIGGKQPSPQVIPRLDSLPLHLFSEVSRPDCRDTIFDVAAARGELGSGIANLIFREHQMFLESRRFRKAFLAPRTLKQVGAAGLSMVLDNVCPIRYQHLPSYHMIRLAGSYCSSATFFHLPVAHSHLSLTLKRAGLRSL